MAQEFTGTLNHNAWATMLYNAYKIMGTQANLENIDSSLVDAIREEGGKLNDKNKYTFIDTVPTREWDPTDTNVLAQEPRPNFVEQEIVVSNARQVAITKSYFLDKQAWGNEGSFAQYITLVDSQVSKAKKLYESKLVSVALGTMEATTGKQEQSIAMPTMSESATLVEEEAYNRLRAQKIAQAFTVLEAEMKDPNGDFTDIGFYDGFDKSKFTVIWNLDWLSKINIFDLPTVYHSDYFDFNGKSMLSKFFGNDVAEETTANGSTHRAKNEYNIIVDESGAYAEKGTIVKTVRPGDILPSGTPIVPVGTELTTTTLDVTIKIKGKSTKITYVCNSTVNAYEPDETIICKIMALGKGVKYISSFQTDGTFQNYKSNSENIYSTWMFSDVEYLGGLPLITVRATASK